jgi:hypothetical protein
MVQRKSLAKELTIPCALSDERKKSIEAYMSALVKAAPFIGDHGMTPEEFVQSGLLASAVEKLRGTQSASTGKKKVFIDRILARLKSSGRISDFNFTGSGDRHDYHVTFPGNYQSVIESKGCLDGNNTAIFERPANADEFVIWSLCQNAGSDPKKNVWSGVHTRIGTQIIAQRQLVDALIVWDMNCGSLERPCPKLLEGGRGITVEGIRMPPPCIYLFPRTVPDARNNSMPQVRELHEIKLASALLDEFGGDGRDVTKVFIEVRMNGANIERKTSLVRHGISDVTSGWTKLKRVR